MIIVAAVLLQQRVAAGRRLTPGTGGADPTAAEGTPAGASPGVPAT